MTPDPQAIAQDLLREQPHLSPHDLAVEAVRRGMVAGYEDGVDVVSREGVAYENLRDHHKQGPDWLVANAMACGLLTASCILTARAKELKHPTPAQR